jgi:hypothetical protein
MADRTITSADSTFVISSADFALAATIIEGYAADAAFAMDNVDTAETSLGVDGKLSGGWVPRAYPQTITLQPDSPSRPLFDGLVTAQDAARTIFRLNAVITLPGNQYSHSLSRGILKNITPMATAHKILQPMTYQILWEKVLTIPLG